MRSARPALALALLALSAAAAAAAPSVVQHPRPASLQTATPPRGAATPGKSDAGEGRELIIAAVAAPRHVSFVGQLSTIRSGTREAYAVVAKIEHRAPDETRRTYLAPRSLYGQYVISRGALSWDVDPARREVIMSENRAAVDPTAVVDDIALLDQNYRAVRTASDDIADRRVDVVDLVSKFTGERTLRLWIDAQTHVVLAREAYHSDGSLAWRMRYDDIRYTDAIPTAIFSAAVPNGFKTVRGRTYGTLALPSAVPDAGFKPVMPRYLPDGFSIVGADVSQVKDVKNLHLVYSDGIRSLSLFENAIDRAIDFSGMQPQHVSFERHDATYVHDGPTTLLSWREHGLAFALVGDLELKELVRIAESVIP